jgi:hypothetical protein
MAVPTGSGTETLHSHFFQDVDADQTLIFGVQYHVYTVLSIIIYCNALNATTNEQVLRFKGHDGHAGVSSANMIFAKFPLGVGETYVWNDKFSFNGAEQAGTNVLDAAEQIAIAAQGGGTVQSIAFIPANAADDFDIMVTYLDQDWT